VSKFKSACEKLVIGDGQKETTTIGPLIDSNAAEDVKSLIEDAKIKGARVELGGNICDLGDNFINPTILSNINTSMRVFNEEIFGPVAPIIKFETENEAIELANQTDFGLAAYFYSRDVGRVYRVSEKLEFGIIGVNEGIISNEMAPFGGIKESGNGREGSKYGLDDYLEIKYVCVGGINE
jgi:succinate-semialdehyde dehydrogenase/glutarate-semialdehyde dehydrogenase